MNNFICTILKGNLTLLEHESAKWLSKETLDGSLTLAHSRNSQMSFMYGFFFRQIFIFNCCMCCNCDIIVVKDGASMKLYYDKRLKDPTYYIQQGFRNGKKTTTKNIRTY